MAALTSSIAAQIRKKWKRRRPGSHKGDYGRVFILAGSRGFSGAAHLAAMGAVRSGAGLVTLGCPEAVYPALARREAEIMVRPFPSTPRGALARSGFRDIMIFSKTQDVLALGPGLSRDPQTQGLVRSVLRRSALPMVLDADALNALVPCRFVLRKCAGRTIVTPHEGEFARLFGGARSFTANSRKARAVRAAVQYGTVVVLKGHHTVIATPEGKTFLNPTGNPGMATGGTGDVLTGVIAGLIAQGFGLVEAARFGVFLHGLAGDMAVRRIGQVGMAAGDLPGFVAAAIRKTLGF